MYAQVHCCLCEPEFTSFYLDVFRLHCRTRSFTFFTATADLNSSWIEDIRDSATGAHDKVIIFHPNQDYEYDSLANPVYREPFRRNKKLRRAHLIRVLNWRL